MEERNKTALSVTGADVRAEETGDVRDRSDEKTSIT
jgi:hypothetical protein